MKKYLFFAAMLFSGVSFGQISNVDMNGTPARLTTYSEIEGSPYLFNDWAKADIGTTNAGLKQDVAYRFNIHDNELEVVNEAGNKIYLNKDYVEYVVLQRPSILIAEGTPGLLPNLLFKKGFDFVRGIGPKDLVNVLAEGDYTLIRRFYSDLVTPPKNSYAPTPGRMFVFEETYYLIDKDENVTSVKNKTNTILKALKEADQEKAKSILKEDKLDLSREDHLVRFFTKLNEK
ncbi:hypothetical protein [Algoriphagus sanaruensis]|uniref:Uncharacterized protein n=1 Tax=Algoriphagus sanaruensis TaxID=1727163 RepID=A0A142EMJ1_9BACT|nr:hypothetical protein [Algoriphagus sanaruensis]AMQ56346.1 hypothetical protein AO498_07950 [Algoriphagus sanaruensis]